LRDKPYTGPIPINGNDEVKIYAYAEDAGVETQKTVTIRPVKGGEVQIDPDRPVVIKKRQKIASTKDVFVVINALKAAHGKIRGSLSATVGQGDVNATTHPPQSCLARQLIESIARAAVGTSKESPGRTCPTSGTGSSFRDGYVSKMPYTASRRLWQTPEELAAKLRNRIRAVIGMGPDLVREQPPADKD
jgi:hypothetical protein